jgi:hypothetical protein
VTRDEAHEALVGLAAGVRERSEPEAVQRLLERLAQRDAPELRDALLEAGARAVLAAARPGHQRS